MTSTYTFDSTDTDRSPSAERRIVLGEPIVLQDALQDRLGVQASIFENEHSVVIDADRYGIVPLFYHLAGNRLIVSTEIAEVANRLGSISLSQENLAVFFYLGFFLGPDTPFNEIQTLGPGERITWQHGQSQVEQKQYFDHRPASTLVESDAVDTYIDLFNTSMRRRKPTKKCILPLTGGKDSRHVLMDMLRSDVRPNACITCEMYPPRDNADCKTAKHICDNYALKHYRLATYPQFEAEQEKNANTYFCSDEHTWAISYKHFLQQFNEPLVSFDGIGGDILSSSRLAKPIYHQHYINGELDQIADAILPRDGTPLFDGLPEHWRLDGHHDYVKQRVIAELQSYRDWQNPVNMFFFFSRTRRESSLISFGVLRHACRAYMPFLDRDVFDFLTSLPPSIIQEKSIHTDAFQKAFPESLEIPFSLPKPRRFAGICEELRLAAGVSVQSIRHNNQWWGASLPKTLRTWKQARTHSYRNRYLYLSPKRLLYAMQLDTFTEELTHDRSI